MVIRAGDHVVSHAVGPSLSVQRLESEEWESDGGEGSPRSMRRVTARVGSATTCHLPALTRPRRCTHAQACMHSLAFPHARARISSV